MSGMVVLMAMGATVTPGFGPGPCCGGPLYHGVPPIYYEPTWTHGAFAPHLAQGQTEFFHGLGHYSKGGIKILPHALGVPMLKSPAATNGKMPRAGDDPEDEERSPERDLSAPAEVVISLPPDARLFADGRPTAQGDEMRRFRTPHLEAGQTYGYTFRVEYERDGHPVTAEERLTVRAGDRLRVEFPDRGSPVVSVDD